MIIWPVSYTHLDVYKRQLLIPLTGYYFFQYLLLLNVITAERQDWQTSFKHTTDAVSYTHLAVYKRQELYYINGEEGSRETTTNSAQANKTIIGSVEPTVQGGLTNFVSWKFIYFNMTLTYSLGAVSYTHLDVYKRQLSDRWLLHLHHWLQHIILASKW